MVLSLFVVVVVEVVQIHFDWFVLIDNESDDDLMELDEVKNVFHLIVEKDFLILENVKALNYIKKKNHCKNKIVYFVLKKKNFRSVSSLR